MAHSLIEQFRYFLKDRVRLTIDFSQTDQSRRVVPPPIEKLFATDAERIDLVDKNKLHDVEDTGLITAIESRKSHRHFKSEPLTIDELSFLLWATQGIRKKVDDATAYRNVPSAGCRHALETYLCVLDVTGLETGIYRYLPLEHQLLSVCSDQNLASKLVHASLDQPFPGNAPVTFIWTAVPYRMEWRYDLAAHKVILLDAGHVCQNLYLACAAIKAGTCAIAAYHQDLMDQLLQVDGEDEFAIYLAPVGKI